MSVEVYTKHSQGNIDLIKKMSYDFLTIANSPSREGMRISVSFYGYKVVIVPENKDIIGFCKRDKDVNRITNYTIGISERLLEEDVTAETLREVVGHEVAHYIAMKEFENSEHGELFREICSILGVKNDKTKLGHSLFLQNGSNKTLEKIKKLLALSESSNINESQSALVKAKKLMQDNRITSVDSVEQEKIYRVCLQEYKAYTAETAVLVQVIKLITGVWILKSDSGSSKKVYAHGTKSTVEIAEYLYSYLKREIYTQYISEKKRLNLKGSAKKSFYYGVLNEMGHRFKDQLQDNPEWALVSLDYENERKSKRFIYPTSRFYRSSSNSNINNRGAYSSGREVGKNVRIHNGISNQPRRSGLYLT